MILPKVVMGELAWDLTLAFSVLASLRISELNLIALRAARIAVRAKSQSQIFPRQMPTKTHRLPKVVFGESWWILSMQNDKCEINILKWEKNRTQINPVR